MGIQNTFIYIYISIFICVYGCSSVFFAIRKKQPKFTIQNMYMKFFIYIGVYVCVVYVARANSRFFMFIGTNV